jgi:hypothetical protein
VLLHGELGKGLEMLLWRYLREIGSVGAKRNIMGVGRVVKRLRRKSSEIETALEIMMSSKSVGGRMSRMQHMVCNTVKRRVVVVAVLQLKRQRLTVVPDYSRREESSQTARHCRYRAGRHRDDLRYDGILMFLRLVVLSNREAEVRQGGAPRFLGLGGPTA